MKEVNFIIDKHKELFSENPNIEKITVGFTNTIYNVDNNYIIKICTNKNNEENFIKEIDFYNNNKENKLIPKLYYSSTDKKDIPYFYGIIEKIDGISLYNVWHTLSEVDKESIIMQLCDFMKNMHSKNYEEFDWSKYLKKDFLQHYNKTKNNFSFEEQQLIEYAYSKYDKYLSYDNNFSLIHNDLHFDNIFYNEGKIKIIDFERSMIAPIDYELNILYNMVDKPWKFASKETEEYTNSSDYGNIKVYIEKYYPELAKNPYLEQRLSIYKMNYYLKQLCNYPNDKELKDDIISSAKIVALKDQLHFEDLETPEELLNFMDINIEYGWTDLKSEKHINNLDGFREKYRTSSIEEILETGLGTCIEQAKLIKLFFDKIGLDNKMFCFRIYEDEENFDKDVEMHLFVLYKNNNNWYHFEHSNFNFTGIHEYNSLDEAINNITNNIDKSGIRKLTEIDDIPDGLTFKEFNLYVNNYKDLHIQKTH